MKLSLITITLVILLSLLNTSVSAQTVTGYDYQAGTKFNYKISNVYDNFTTFITHETNSIPLLNHTGNNYFGNLKLSEHLFVNNETITAYLKNDVNNSINRGEILICLVNFTSFLTIPTFKNIYTENNQPLTYDFNNSDILGPLMNHFPILYRSFNNVSDLEYFIQAYPHVATRSGLYNFTIESNYMIFSHYTDKITQANTELISNYNITYNWRTGIFKSYSGYFSSKDSNNVTRIHQYLLQYTGMTSPDPVSTPYNLSSLFIAFPLIFILRKKPKFF